MNKYLKKQFFWNLKKKSQINFLHLINGFYNETEPNEAQWEWTTHVRGFGIAS